MKKLFLLATLLLITKISSAQIVSADSAKYYEGKIVTVKGKVFSTYKSQGDKQKILLNIGKPYPEQPFSVVIFEENFSKFSYRPEEFLKDKDITVKGKVTMFKDKPQIMVNNPNQIEVK